MKKTLLLLWACLICGLITNAEPVARENPNDGKKTEISKAERKAKEKKIQAMRDSVDNLKAIDAIQEQYFVVMAKRMTLRGYTDPSPQSNMNFVLVQGDKATVQIAFNNGRSGFNGLGGITVDGTISGVKHRSDKKGNNYMDFNVMGPAISADVHITLYKGSNQAMAIINPNFGPGDLTIYGPLVPYQGTDIDKVFKGKTTY